MQGLSKCWVGDQIYRTQIIFTSNANQLNKHIVQIPLLQDEKRVHSKVRFHKFSIPSIILKVRKREHQIETICWSPL